MKRSIRLSLVIALGLLATLLVAGTAMARGNPIVGTWHQRDVGTSNIFYFVDRPIGGVYHVLFYDDWTVVCDNNGPMLWAGFAVKNGDTLEGNFGRHWCPDTGEGPQEGGGILVPWEFSLTYDPDTDTISGGLGQLCVGTRQPNIKTVRKAIRQLAKGKYPPSPLPIDPACQEDPP